MLFSKDVKQTQLSSPSFLQLLLNISQRQEQTRKSKNTAEIAPGTTMFSANFKLQRKWLSSVL